MEILRTPDDRFANLPDYPFAPNYVEVPDGEGGELRIHHVDEGPKEAAPVLLLHGEPSWSFLYRKMIPPLVAGGLRAVAPDLVGFGRSDKPARREDHTYQRHVDWMTAWLNALDLQNITLFCQDWGGLIGLRLLAENPDRFARVMVANTGLPTGDQKMPDAFYQWQQFSQAVSKFPVGRIINGATTTVLTKEVLAGYNAPFPDESYKEAARIMPTLVPTTPDDPAAEANRAAWGVLRRLKTPVRTAFSDSDPVTKGGERIFQKVMRGAKGQAHQTIENAGHFLQEDKGEELAALLRQFVQDSVVD